MAILVLGIGNVLMGDDALGPWVVASLDAAFAFPPEVALLDAGTPGIELPLFLEGLDALVAVDAIRGRGAPGEVRSFRKRELLAGGAPLVMSPHEPSLREALLRLELLGTGPREVLVVGAIPGRIEASTAMTRPVRDAIPELQAHVLRELRRLGVAPTPRAHPRAPSPWWEAPRSTSHA
jgi:hydrogenase maturation protease